MLRPHPSSTKIELGFFSKKSITYWSNFLVLRDNDAGSLFRNFPFLFHIAFMGMEVTGDAVNNYENVWIDPFLYKIQLKNAAQDIYCHNYFSAIGEYQ